MVASVDVRGKVLLKGEPVQGVVVTALSTSSFKTKTNASGSFRFASLPIKTGENDTTVYQIKISTGIFSKSYLLEVGADQLGKRINLPNTILPSGQIELTVTDGVDPIEGAILEFGISGGESERIITPSNGKYMSSENLRKATYVVSVSKSGLLVPQNTIRLELPSDTTLLRYNVVLPYRQLPVTKILADAKTEVAVVHKPEYNASKSSGILYYKKASQNQFLQVSMTKTGDTLQAEIPALYFTEDITFYTSITDSAQNNTYLSSQKTITPLASGILTNIRVTPTLSGQTLRVGETYNLELFVRDGINKSLEDRFNGDDGDGYIVWENLTDSSGLKIISKQGTRAQLVAEKPGNYTLKVTANLDGSLVSKNIDMNVSAIPLKTISVSIPAKQLSNSTTHLFGYSAIDTSGNSVLLGESLKWTINPAPMGTVDSRGVFTPASNSHFGTFSVTVSDSISGLKGISDQVELVARVEPDKEYVLTNGLGLELSIPAGAIEVSSQVSLAETRPADTKKYVFAQGGDVSYTVGERIYQLSFSGSELKKPAQLTLPEDTTISELHTGARSIAQFNFTTLQWEILESLVPKTVSQGSGTVIIEKLGQFAVLAANEPLGIKHAAVLPSPFSPGIAPVKIGYWLDTSFPPAKVSIKIYNLRGELVRTLFEDELQQPGRYGSSTSNREITWDGLTDNGNMARNGRYIVQIVAKDQQDEVVELLQVVLIK